MAIYSPQTARFGKICNYDLSQTAVTIAKTIDGGRHWTAQLHFTGDSTVGGGSARLPGVWMHFVNRDVGFVAGPATQTQAWLYRTRDGGKIWRKLRLPGIPGAFPFSFANASNGWLLANVEAASDQSWAHIFHTSDGGTHWIRAAQFGHDGEGVAGDVSSIVVRRDGVGWVTAFALASPGYVYSTKDAGKRWSFQNLTLPKIDLPKGFINSVGTPYSPVLVSARHICPSR